MIDPCSNYSQLDNSSRSIHSKYKNTMLDDRNKVNNTWYRFNAINSTMMITYPVGMLKCGTIFSGWLTIDHPRGNVTAFR